MAADNQVCPACGAVTDSPEKEDRITRLRADRHRLEQRLTDTLATVFRTAPRDRGAS